MLRKFQTHADIRDILLSTGDELIVENAPRDYYWGCSAKGTGKNMLGVILMEVRSHSALKIALQRTILKKH